MNDESMIIDEEPHARTDRAHNDRMTLSKLTEFAHFKTVQTTLYSE